MVNATLFEVILPSFESPPRDLRMVFAHLLILLGPLNRIDQTPTSLFVAHPRNRQEEVFHNQRVRLGHLAFNQRVFRVLVGQSDQFQLL